ncbi:MAG: hypothetical protein ABIK62_05935, partial [candidate division WOR-3 bacterium]
MTKYDIGLVESDLAWLQILGQERVNYRLWTPESGEPGPRVIVLNRPLTEGEVEKFRSYVEAGAGVLTDFPNLALLVPGFKCTEVEVIRYIEPEPVPVFNGLGLIDLELPGYCSNQANFGHLDNQGAALCARALGQGYVIALPFDVAAALRDRRHGLKTFYHPGTELPYEDVAVVSHGAIRRLCANALRELCRQIHMPYVHVWYYPDFKRSAFIFRVDGDFARKDDFVRALELAQRHALKFTWFINAKAQQSFLSYFAELAKQGHDVQLHCFEHRVAKTEAEKL